MHVEHGADSRAADIAYDAGRLVEGLHDIALVRRQRFHENGNSAGCSVRSYGSEAIGEVTRGFCARETTGSAALLRRAEDEHASLAEIGAEIDEIADVIPTAAPQTRVRRGDVQTLGADHEPVESDKGQAFG